MGFVSFALNMLWFYFRPPQASALRSKWPSQRELASTFAVKNVPHVNASKYVSLLLVPVKLHAEAVDK